MGRTSRICVSVIDGNTIVTNKRARIGLARVESPPINTPEGRIAKELLESLILGQFITYDGVAIGPRRREVEAVAEVWLDDRNVNDAMRAAGYQEPSPQTQPSVSGRKTEAPTTKA
jgi:endonuclease YncB( thermonuclease family)